MKYKLQDLIDMEHFQNLQDRLNKIYSFPSSIIDNDGNILTATAWQDICTQFHRKNKDCEKLCIKSDQYIKDHIHEANPAVSYRCPHGLVDNAIPIIIEGEHYGNFFTGQFFLEEPNLHFFRVQAKRYGFDEVAYIEAVKKVPIWTKEQLDNYLFFIKELIAVISENGLKKFREIENSKEIEKREVRHRSILKTAMDGYWLTDINGRLLEVNDTYCRMSGYSEDELLTMHIPDFEIIETPEVIAEHMQKVVMKGFDRFESRHRRKDGTVFDVEVSIQFRSEEGGQCVCFIRDITELKTAAKELSLSKAQLRILVDTIPDLVWLKDPDGVYLGCNLTFERFLGAKEDSIIGKTDYDLVDKEFADFFRKHDRKAIEKDGILINEDWLTFSDNGYYGLFETIRTPMRNADGTMIGVLGIARDISERKQAEKKLLNSEQKWRNILINTPQIGISLDPEAHITFVNEQFLKLTGWEKKEIIGQNWFDLFIPEDIREEVRKVFHTVMSQKDTTGYMTYENEIMDKSGRLVNVAWSNVLTKDENGYVVDVTCLGIDLTERIRAEKALAESEAYMQSIFRAAPTGIGVVYDRVIKEVNETFCQMLSYAKDELIGQRAEFVYSSVDEYERVGKEKYEQIKESGTGTVETVLKRKDGKQIDVLLSSTPIDQNDLNVGVTFTALDITERKKTERSLRDSHERFLTVLDSIDASIHVSDMENYEILFMNQNMIDSFGKDFTGKKCWQVFRGESESCAFCSNSKLIDENGKSTGLYTWHDENPVTKKWYINHDRAINWVDGRVVRLQVATDITELKQLEEKIRDAQKIESIGNLAGGIAHDFNNILCPIIGMSELLLEDLPAGSPENEDVREILNAGKRGRDLVKQILAFSRQSERIMTPTRIQSILKEVLKLSRSTIPSNIELNHHVQSNCGLIMADPIQIHQIAMNIITNAYHAVEDEGGKITVALSETQVDDSDFSGAHMKPGTYAMLSVSDTGHGISTEFVNKIFDPYFTTKKTDKGTGLGLSVVYGIVQEHKGYIDVISEVNDGTTFKVYFPLMERTVETATSDVLVAIPKGHERILLVDDEMSVAKLEKKMLERLGYKVTMFINSQEALQTIRANPMSFDLVISDMTMPNMTGDQLAGEVKSIRPDIPVIICTGFSNKMNTQKADSLGIAAILMKPVIKSDLAKMIREVLDEAKKL